MYNVLHNTRCTLVTVHRTLHTARCTLFTVHRLHSAPLDTFQPVMEVVAKSNDVTNSSSTVGLAFSQCGRHLAIPTTAGLTLVTRGGGGVWGAPRPAGMALAKGELATALALSCEGDLLMVATNKVAICS